MPDLEVKTADCSSDTLIKTAKKCGFVIEQGRKHYKIKTINGQFITTVPRHTRLKRELVKGVIGKLNQFSITKVVAR
ncbi:MAG: hypothetical protein AAB863_01120 [Patescibacteria group bacterium]